LIIEISEVKCPNVRFDKKREVLNCYKNLYLIQVDLQFFMKHIISHACIFSSILIWVKCEQCFFVRISRKWVVCISGQYNRASSLQIINI